MTTTSAGLSPQECVRLFIEHRRRWLIPMVICAMLSTGYAMVMSRYWQATQALVVRSEVSGTSQGQPGKFSDVYEMRSFQETVLELAKSRQVLAATLMAVEKPATDQPTKEPTASKIKFLREHLSLLPPNGAEFGKTEIFYLSVKDKNRELAIQLVNELCNQLDQRLRNLRAEQSQSVVAELELQMELASQAHKTETTSLENFESKMGADLGELRMLHSANSGQSDLRQQAVNLENEHRSSEAKVRQAEQLLSILQSAQNSPEELIAMPSSLLDSQPTLRSLKDGLLESQLRAARLTSTRTIEHPQLQAAEKAVKQIRSDLHHELLVAIKGVEIELSLNKQHTLAIGKQLANVQQRLTGLAQQRAEYTNLLATVENSREVLSQVGRQLNEVRAAQLAARNTRLVTPIDRPDVGENPVGTGRASVVLIGTFGGFILGIGCLFLSIPQLPITTEEATPEPVNRNQDEHRSQRNPVEKNFSYASSQDQILASMSSATIIDAYDRSLPIHEVFDEHLAIADDLSMV